jgi:hypothetical protein
MVLAVWKTISLLLALSAFIIVGVMSVLSDEDLLWATGKAIGSFVACWVVIGFLGNILRAVMDRHDVADKTTKM